MRVKKLDKDADVFQEKVSKKIIKKAVENKNKTDNEFYVTYYEYKKIKYTIEKKNLKLIFDF